MSNLIENILRLIDLVKNETRSGGNTAARIGGLFEEIAAELELKYDKSDCDLILSDLRKFVTDHLNVFEIHKTSEQIRAEIVDADIPSTLARVADVDKAIADLVSGSPEALDTLKELAAALGNDPNFATSILALIAAKADFVHTHAATQITEDATHRFLTDAERAKLAGVAAGANNYIHPGSHPASIITEETNKRFMTDAERTKLTGIATGANNYIHPGSHPASIITEDTTHRFFTDAERTKLAGVAAGANNYIHPGSHPASIITEETNKRFMTDAERTKLAGVAAGANNYIHPGSHPASIITEETNKHFMTDAERAKLVDLQPFDPDNLLKIRMAGRIAPDGTLDYFSGQSKFTITRTGMGVYCIRHNLASAKVCLMVSSSSGYANVSYTNNMEANIYVRTVVTDVRQDSYLSFILFMLE